MIERTYLPSGFRLQIEDGREFVISKPIGQGGTALTYMGEEIIEGQEPVRVLLKELYPRMDGIARNEDGTVAGNNLQAKILLKDMEEFLFVEQETGNQIARQDVLGVYPMTSVIKDSVTGNKFGLFYQCPPSVSLKQFVEKYGAKISLRGKLLLAQALARIVQGIHEKGGFAHCDISAGNVLVMAGMFPELEERLVDWSAFEAELQVGVIDFACAFPITYEAKAEFFSAVDGMQFHTEGYSAPELYEVGAEVSETADIYSVCACLWFLLTGQAPKTLDGHAILDVHEWNLLSQSIAAHELYSLSGDISAVFGRNPYPVPGDVSQRLMEILERGLADQNDRYGSMEILMDRIKEILALVEGTSISQQTMADRAWKAYEARKHGIGTAFQIRESLLPLATDHYETKPLVEYYESGESIYTIGVGGSGKTTSIFHLIERWKAAGVSVIPIYLELNKCQMWKPGTGHSVRKHWIGKDSRPSFVEQYMAGIYYGCFGSMAGREDVMVGAMKRQLERTERSGYRYLILMDGLNEMTFSGQEERDAFLEALNWYLIHVKNAQIILTSRYDDAFVGSGHIRRIQVCGIADESIQRYLEEELQSGHIKQKEYDNLINLSPSDTLKKCLQLPLFLQMYCKIWNKEGVSSAGEILSHYFHKKREAVDGSRDYTERRLDDEKYKDCLFVEGLSMSLARRMTVDFIMPEIGLMMVEQKRFFVDKALLRQVIERCLAGIWSSSMCKRYSYQVDIEEAKQAFRKADPENILEELCMNLGILGRSGEDSFYFQHQYYRDYFAAVAILNRFAGALGSGSDWETMIERKWPESVLRLCGEVLGIHHTVPEQKNGRWVQTGQWDPMFDVMLDCCRHREREHGLTKHVVEMIRLTRLHKGRPDFSGIDLSDICLLGIDLRECIFSHPAKTHGIYAKLKGTELGGRKYLSSLREHDYFDFHSKDWEERSTTISPDGIWLLKTISTNSSTYLEEESVFGGEIKGLGVWDRCLQPKYSTDGKWIGFLSYKVLDGNNQFTVHFYNRQSGKILSEDIPYGICIDCIFDWYGDQFVLLQMFKGYANIMRFQIREGTVEVAEDNVYAHNLEGLTTGCIGTAGSIYVSNWRRLVLIKKEQPQTMFQIGNVKCFAYDHRYDQTYFATWEGMLYSIDAQENVTWIGKNNLLCKVCEMVAEKGRLFLRIEDVLCEWDFEKRILQAIQWGHFASWEQAFSCAGNYGVWKDGTVFRLNDGDVVRRGTPTENQDEDIPFMNPFISFVMAPTEEYRLWVLDTEKKIQYYFAPDTKGAMRCIGYEFVETEVCAAEKYELPCYDKIPRIINADVSDDGRYLELEVRFGDGTIGHVKQRCGWKTDISDILTGGEYLLFDDGMLVLHGLRVTRLLFKKRGIEIIHPSNVPHMLTVGCEMDT